jgi:hypothetical protein
MKFDFVHDAGHGWMRVRRDQLVSLGLQNNISRYSYQSGDWCWLEEDCDAPLFIRAMQALGQTVEFRERWVERSRIRNYDCYVSVAR